MSAARRSDIERVARAIGRSAANRPRKEGTVMRFERYAEAAINTIAGELRTPSDREAVERLAHQLRVALTIVDPGGYGTWRGNAQRALAEAERRGLVSAHTPTVVRTEGV